jgi:hypothetical protein
MPCANLVNLVKATRAQCDRVLVIQVVVATDNLTMTWGLPS